jgi:hypothetical protein
MTVIEERSTGEHVREGQLSDLQERVGRTPPLIGYAFAHENEGIHQPIGRAESGARGGAPLRPQAGSSDRAVGVEDRHREGLASRVRLDDNLAACGGSHSRDVDGTSSSPRQFGALQLHSSLNPGTCSAT